MAIVKKREKLSGSEDYVIDRAGVSQAMSWPTGLSIFERISLYRKGKHDARHGLVSIDEYGEIYSPYCESLTQFANQRIELEWAECNKNSFDALECIKRSNIRIDELNRELKEARTQRDEALSFLRARKYDGDAVVSEHLSARRQQNREKPFLDLYEQKSESLESQLAAAESESVPYRYALQKACELASSREQLVRADFLWRLSAYAYGASSYLKINADMISDSSLSDRPRAEHKKLFGAYISETVDDSND